MSNQNYGPYGEQPGQPQGPGSQSSPQYNPQAQPGQGGQGGQQPPPLPGQGGQPPGGQPGYGTQPNPQPNYPAGPTTPGYGVGANPGGPQPPPGQPGYGPQGAQPGFGGPSQPSYGGPGHPNYGGQGYGGGGTPPPATKSGGMGKYIAIGVVVLALLAVAIFAFFQRGNDGGGESTTAPTTQATDTTTSAPSSAVAPPSAPGGGGTDYAELSIGDCVQFVEVADTDTASSGDTISVGHEVVDCNLAGQFKLLVASSHDGAYECPTDYVGYFQMSSIGTGRQQTLCLAPVLEPNRCYTFDPLYEWIDVPCDSAADLMIESELSGTDPAACSDPEWEHFVLPEPAPGKVYCIVDPPA